METSDRIASARPLDKSTEIAAGEQALRARVPRDFRTLRRIVTAISIVLGPLAIGIVRATVPAVNPSDGKAAIAAMMANPDMARIELAAGVVATLFLPFAIVGLMRLVMRGAPVLAMLGGGLALIGWALVPTLVTIDAMTYVMAHSGANPTQFASLWDQVNGNIVVNLLTTIFVVGHELGTLLPGIGLVRARAVPLWAAVAVMLGILLHPVGFGLGIRPLDILGFALLIIGCVAAARAILILPNDAWDLPSLPVHKYLWLAIVFGASVATQIYRYRRVASPVQRQQIKWLIYGFAPVLIVSVCFQFALLLFPALHGSNSLLPVGTEPLFRFYYLPIPVCVGIALLRYRLWDIDVIINRTLVYMTLTVSVIGLYVLVVVGLGTLIQVQGNLALSLLATGLIAVLFQPLRLRLQRAVNRLLYGERDDPYTVLARLGSRLEATLVPETVLPTIVETGIAPNLEGRRREMW